MSDTKTKSSENKEMWMLLNKLFDVIAKLPWHKIWDWLTHVPNIIKYLLIFTVLAGGLYFAYTRFYTRTNIEEVQEQVIKLNQRIENVLSASDYEVDVEYMVVTLYLLEELNEQQWQVSKRNSDVLIRHMEHVNPTDPLIIEMKASQQRLEQQHNALRTHFQTGIKKFCPSEKIEERAQQGALNNDPK